MSAPPPSLKLRVGCRFDYRVPAPTVAVTQVEARAEGQTRLLESSWAATPEVPTEHLTDFYGNSCRRLVMPVGRFRWTYDAVLEVAPTADEFAPEAPQVPIEKLPGEVLHFTLPSRYCLSDVLMEPAWQLFGSTEPGWARVQAVNDWVHREIEFAYGSSSPMTTAKDVFDAHRGVCRDFAHLAISFCRALGIPARYVFGYLPDIGVPPPATPMDFCAWTEAYLGGRWFTFDPRNNRRRVGRAVIGRGRDALDVAMITTYGPAEFEAVRVWANQVTAGAPGSG